MLALLAFSSDVILYIYIYGPTTLVSSHYIAWSEFIVIYTIFYTCTSSFFNRHLPQFQQTQGPKALDSMIESNTSDMWGTQKKYAF